MRSTSEWIVLLGPSNPGAAPRRTHWCQSETLRKRSDAIRSSEATRVHHCSAARQSPGRLQPTRSRPRISHDYASSHSIQVRCGQHDLTRFSRASRPGLCGWANHHHRLPFRGGSWRGVSGLAAECLRLKADIIALSTTPATQAAKKATRSIPIVMIGLGDPVGTGLVNSLAQPGANVTGMSMMVPELATKRLELLKEAFAGSRGYSCCRILPTRLHRYR